MKIVFYILFLGLLPSIQLVAQTNTKINKQTVKTTKTTTSKTNLNRNDKKNKTIGVTVKPETKKEIRKDTARNDNNKDTLSQNRKKNDKDNNLIQNTTQPISTGSAAPVGYLCNPPLPYKPAKLDVLFIGNSFSIDTSSELPSILASLGINNVNVYVLYKGACSLKEHFQFYKTDNPVYDLYLYNSRGETLLEKKTTIKKVMSRYDYDIVVFQQYSLLSGNYSSYEPYLGRLIQAYKLNAINPRTTFAFNETWAYGSKHKNIKEYQNPLNMWKQICLSTRKMKEESGIDIIIPCGTAVQNARAVPMLKTEKELTRDNQHLDLYMGRYLAACTFFESIIAPCLGRSIREDKSVIGKNGERNQVNATNRRLLQNCARLAVANNYVVSSFAGE